MSDLNGSYAETKETLDKIKEADKAAKRKLPVDNIVSWPKAGQEVAGYFSGRIGTVGETKKGKQGDMALVDFGMNEEWIYTSNLKEIDS